MLKNMAIYSPAVGLSNLAQSMKTLLETLQLKKKKKKTPIAI